MPSTKTLFKLFLSEFIGAGLLLAIGLSMVILCNEPVNPFRTAKAVVCRFPVWNNTGCRRPFHLSERSAEHILLAALFQDTNSKMRAFTVSAYFICKYVRILSGFHIQN
jgi:hypothetical protein